MLVIVIWILCIVYMRHRYFGKKLSRTKNERRSLLRNLARDVFLKGSIRTTLAKAKAVQPFIEKLITLAKKGTDRKKQEVMQELPYKDVVKKLFLDAETRFASRTSGFTSIVKLGTRMGDNSQTALLRFVDEDVAVSIIGPKETQEQKIVPPKGKNLQDKNTNKVKKEKQVKKFKRVKKKV